MPVRRERVADFIYDENGARQRVRRIRETLPNGVTYETLDLRDDGILDNTQEYLVPAGHYFALGDNRDNSTDSRVLTQMGYIPFENLIGRIAFVLPPRPVKAADAQTTAPAQLSIKEKDIQEAEKRGVIAVMCTPDLSAFTTVAAISMKLKAVYGKEAEDQMIAIYAQKRDDLYNKIIADNAATIAAKGIFAQPSFDACKEAKQWSDADIVAANKAWLAVNAPHSPSP
jgi:hypothetical protein